MKKALAAIIMIVIMIILLVIIDGYISKVGDDFTKITNDSKSFVGKKIILEKDTLMIIDYSFLNETFTLSNNVVINQNLVKKLKIVE